MPKNLKKKIQLRKRENVPTKQRTAVSVSHNINKRTLKSSGRVPRLLSCDMCQLFTFKERFPFVLVLLERQSHGFLFDLAREAEHQRRQQYNETGDEHHA